jgi:hypothetical protein
MFSEIVRVFSTESSEGDAGEFVREILDAGETIMWIKRPSRQLALEPVEKAMMQQAWVWATLGTVFVTLAVLSFFVEFRQKAPAVVRLLFIAVLVVLLGGHLLHQKLLRARRRNHFYYVLTDCRVLVADLSARRVVFDLDLRTMDMPRATEFGQGIGTITFGPAPPALGFWNHGRRTGEEFLVDLGLKPSVPSLKLVDNVAEVLGDILVARSAAFAQQQC